MLLATTTSALRVNGAFLATLDDEEQRQLIALLRKVLDGHGALLWAEDAT